MTQITREIYIDAPKEKVWKTLADFGGVAMWNPNVYESHSTSKNNDGLNASRYCDLAFGANVQERIIEWHEGEWYTLEVYDGKRNPPVNLKATVKVREQGKGTLFTFTMDYTMKMGAIGAVMNAVVLKSQMNKIAGTSVAGMKHYCETDQLVDKKTRLNLEPVAIPA